MLKINEKATYARIPEKFKLGISTQLLENPKNLKLEILKSLTISVTRYKATAEETHLKTPKVIRFSGKSRRFIIGFARIEVAVKPIPAINKVVNPFLNTNPSATSEITHKENVSIAKCLIILFI